MPWPSPYFSPAGRPVSGIGPNRRPWIASASLSTRALTLLAWRPDRRQVRRYCRRVPPATAGERGNRASTTPE